MYLYNTTVKLHDTDAAGLLFFANQLRLAHDCYETFLASESLSFNTILTDRNYLLPIVHAESDYSKPMNVGESLEIRLTVARIGRTSFQLDYDIVLSSGESAGKVSTVHVCTEKINKTSMTLPDELKEILSVHLVRS